MVHTAKAFHIIALASLLLLAACAQQGPIQDVDENAGGKKMPDGAVPCMGRTQGCPADVDPVCGNDDTTYSNGCMACRNEQVSYYLPGMCPHDAEQAPGTGGSPSTGGSNDGEGTMAGFVSCTDQRPEICTMEYNPVCAQVDNGIRCITTPCPSTDRKTYATGCTACADSKVYGYVPGECNPEVDNNPSDDEPTTGPGHPAGGLAARQMMVCNVEGVDRTAVAAQFGYACVDACQQDYDTFAARIGPLCIPHYGEAEISQWDTCMKSTDCHSDQRCALATHTTDGQEFFTAILRCAPDNYANYLINTVGLTTVNENGERSTVIA